MGLFNSLKNTFSDSGSDNIWNEVSDDFQLDKVLEDSEGRPQLIYKHSNRCSVCFFSKAEIEQKGEAIKSRADLHFLNVISRREISNEVASGLKVIHESPQLILIYKGEVAWHASHGAIKGDVVLEELQKL